MKITRIGHHCDAKAEHVILVLDKRSLCQTPTAWTSHRDSFGVLPDLSSPARAPLEAAFLYAYQMAMLIAAGLAGLAAVAGAVLVRPKT